MIKIKKIDVLPENIQISEKVLDFTKTAKPSETGNLPYLLRLKVNARVMLTTNVDVDDRLVNGKIGSIADFKFQEQQVITIYVHFDDQQAVLRKMAKDPVARSTTWAPIERSEASFSFMKKKQISL